MTTLDLQALALGKMTSVLGDRHGRQLMGQLLEKHGLTLGTVDELTRFATELSKMGGFEGAVGAMLGLQAALLDGQPTGARMDPVFARSIARESIGTVRAAFEAAGEGARTLEAAAQGLVEAVTSRYPTVPLARCYALLRFGQLIPFEADFAERFAVARGAAVPLRPDTRVLVLLGSHGTEPGWRDRRQSAGHLAIPLLDPTLSTTAPMIAALLGQLRADIGGGSLSPPTDDADVALRRLGGGLDAMFYVHDARSARDARGRRVIPAEDFVRDYGIRTVFGAGGQWVDGNMVVLVAFTQELLERAQVDPFVAVMQKFKGRTRTLAASGRIFEPW